MTSLDDERDRRKHDVVSGYRLFASYGWGDTWTLVSLALGVLLLAAFVIVERRVAHPLLPFRILASRSRGTSFAVMMIVLNGVIGLSLVVGGLKHHEQDYSLPGASAFLSVIIPLGVIALSVVLPLAWFRRRG